MDITIRYFTGERPRTTSINKINRTTMSSSIELQMVEHPIYKKKILGGGHIVI